MYFFIEYSFVFLPYIIIRPFFPKTRFRDSLEIENNATTKNTISYLYGTYLTKAFYIWAKHFIGFF